MLDGNTTGTTPEKQGFPLFRLLLWGGILAVLIPLGAILALHVPAVQRAIIGPLVGMAGKQAGVDIRVESFDWSPLSRLDLFRVRVRSDGNDLLECPKVRIICHLSMEWPYLVPEELYLEDPLLSLEKSAAGEWIIPGRHKNGGPKNLSGEPAGRLFTPLPRVRISSGTVVVHQDGKTVGTMRGITGTLSLKVVQGADGPAIKLDFGQWQGCAGKYVETGRDSEKNGPSHDRADEKSGNSPYNTLKLDASIRTLPFRASWARTGRA
ncbi:MAG: hypothetical protein ABFD98_08590 [Syntrophobacteraceae bacterium]|nr:hypothetical protein [Desulfobacteraceae bacterium]